MQKNKLSDLEGILQKLEEEFGKEYLTRMLEKTYRHKRKYVKKTYEIDQELLPAFKELIAERELLVKEAFNEAVSDWIKKHRRSGPS